MTVERMVGSSSRAMDARGHASARQRPKRDATRRARTAERPVALFIVGVLSTLALSAGWVTREERYLLPEHGLGYGLGIAGLGSMVLLLLYSLRKRVRALRKAAPIRYWFEIHMILGIVGPVAILFHCRFQLGSLNANVALACTLLVAASGVIGRILYTRVHYGLSGHRATLADAQQRLDSGRSRLRSLLERSPALALEVTRFESFALGKSGAGVMSIWRHLTLGIRARSTGRAGRRELRRVLKRRARTAAVGHTLRDAERELRDYVGAIRAVSEYGFYERLFAIWHVLHLPLTCLLYGSAAVHVLAVHFY